MESQHAEQLDPRKYTLDDKGNIRPDYLFSYWILLWVVVYYFCGRAKESSKWSKYIYENMNPLFLLWLALAENIVVFVKILIYNPTLSIIGKDLAMMLLIKVLPIYILRNGKIKILENILFGMMLFIIYNIYLWFNGQNAYDIYTKVDKYILGDENRTPLFQIFLWLSSNNAYGSCGTEPTTAATSN
jgi:hypothetical protein